MSYVAEQVPVTRQLPGAVQLLAPRKRCGCHRRIGIGDYTLGDQPKNIAPVFPNLTPATPPAPPNIPILLPSSPVFSSVQLGSPSTSPSGGSASSLISLVPSLAAIGTQIAGAASGGANVSGSALTPQQQAAIASANQPSWFSQSTILAGVSNGVLVGGTAAAAVLLALLLKRRR